MNSDDRVLELVAEWDSRRQQGENVSVEELCADCPELLPDLRGYMSSMKATAWLLKTPEDDVDSAAATQLSSSMTLEQFCNCVISSGLISEVDLAEVQTRHNSVNEAVSLAQLLLDEQKLTPFQAQKLCGGNCKGHILGDYAILDEIGAGGMGQVYKARHQRMKRIVALKTLPKQAVNTPQAVARFQREVEAAAMLDHQNIVTAYDAGEADGIHFLVMKYVDGRDLMEIVRDQGPLPVHIAVDYVCQTAIGLSYAHGLGVVHRDIKPGNLLRDHDGTVRILDMGLARLEEISESAEFAETQAALTQAGTVMGTVDFMSPEQALDAKEADARADIYSLGCTLYFLLTGKAPYGGKSLMAKMLAHRDDPIPTLLVSVPAELTDAYERSMAKNVEDRYQTMNEFLTDLQAVDLPDPVALETIVPSAQDTRRHGVPLARSTPPEESPHSIETASVDARGNVHR